MVERDALAKETLAFDGKAWVDAPARSFPLLDAVSRLGYPADYLRLPA